MVEQTRPQDALQNLHEGNSDYRLDSLPVDESQPFEWYNNGEKNMYLPADAYSQKRYISKGFRMGQIDLDELKKKKEEEASKQEYQLTFELT